ncbi:hypothetical protein AGLY_015199 [Aphis glycines]|uniref:Uncharacterized protein n=1 Tax=Aphis glycines TaxID=307491 RepID=A0A6G0T247_APHGL|nr:hypothetical protein AGLY_015199 [Aphis glycines]
MVNKLLKLLSMVKSAISIPIALKSAHHIPNIAGARNFGIKLLSPILLFIYKILEILLKNQIFILPGLQPIHSFKKKKKKHRNNDLNDIIKKLGCIMSYRHLVSLLILEKFTFSLFSSSLNEPNYRSYLSVNYYHVIVVVDVNLVIIHLNGYRIDEFVVNAFCVIVIVWPAVPHDDFPAFFQSIPVQRHYEAIRLSSKTLYNASSSRKAYVRLLLVLQVVYRKLILTNYDDDKLKNRLNRNSYHRETVPIRQWQNPCLILIEEKVQNNLHIYSRVASFTHPRPHTHETSNCRKCSISNSTLHVGLRSLLSSPVNSHMNYDKKTELLLCYC